MKASRHQKMTMHFAESELTRADIQRARQTSQLHRIARAKSAVPGAFIFMAATFITSVSGAERIPAPPPAAKRDRKSTRLNSSHANISYAVFCLKKKNNRN